MAYYNTSRIKDQACLKSYPSICLPQNTAFGLRQIWRRHCLYR